MKNQLSEKIQVLISKEDLKKLNMIILQEALENNNRPVALSTYVRNLIKESITDYETKKQTKQESFISKDLSEINKKK